MATSGNSIVSVGQHNHMQFKWNISKYDKTYNKIYVNWALELFADSQGAITDKTGNKYWSVRINNHAKYGYNNVTIVANGSNKTLATGEFDLAVGSSGVLDIEYEFSQTFDSPIGVVNYGGYDKIAFPKAATITSAPNFNDEQNPAIKYSNSVGIAADKVEVCIADSTGRTIYVPYREVSRVSSNYTFTLTQEERRALYNATPTATDMAVKFYIRTTFGTEKLLSSVSKTFTVVNAEPEANLEYYDTNPETTRLTGNPQRFIRGYSILHYDLNPEAKKGASITSCSCKLGDSKWNTASGNFDFVVTKNLEYSVFDSRLYGVGGFATIDLIEYNPVTCVQENITMAIPSDADDTASATIIAKGSYSDVNFGAAINGLSYKVRYKELEAEEYGEWITSGISIDRSIEGNSYSITATIDGLDYSKVYCFQSNVSDMLSEATSDLYIISLNPAFDWGKDDFKFNIPVIMPEFKHYWYDESYGLDMNDSDIIGCNGIYFNDTVQVSSSEGIHFYRDGSNTDLIWAKDGNLYFTPNHPTGTENYNISGLFKAMTTTHSLTTTTTAGTNYTVTSATAHLTGNNLRLFFRVKRSSNSSAGNIANEKVLSFSITHNGKIKSMNNVSFCSGTYGSVASFDTSNIANNGTTLTFDVTLAATAHAYDEFSSNFVAPVAINPDNY